MVANGHSGSLLLKSGVPVLASSVFALCPDEPGQFVIIYDELIWNFSLALVAVIILSFVMLGPSAVVILVCLTVVSVQGLFTPRSNFIQP